MAVRRNLARQYACSYENSAIFSRLLTRSNETELEVWSLRAYRAVKQRRSGSPFLVGAPPGWPPSMASDAYATPQGRLQPRESKDGAKSWSRNGVYGKAPRDSYAVRPGFVPRNACVAS